MFLLLCNAMLVEAFCVRMRKSIDNGGAWPKFQKYQIKTIILFIPLVPFVSYHHVVNNARIAIDDKSSSRNIQAYYLLL